MKEALSRSILKFVTGNFPIPAPHHFGPGCISPGELEWENLPKRIPVTYSVSAQIKEERPMFVTRFKPVILSGLRLISASRSQGS